MLQSYSNGNVSFLAVTDFSKFGTEEKDYVKRKKFGFICQTILPSLAFIYGVQKLLCFSRWRECGSTMSELFSGFGKSRLKNNIS